MKTFQLIISVLAFCILVPLWNIYGQPSTSYIQKYLEAVYTKWEAEGTDKRDNAVLHFNKSIGKYFNDGSTSGVVTKLNAGAGTLIDGPGYTQEIYYHTNMNDSIIFTVDFRIRFEANNANVKPADTICILQITNTPSDKSKKKDKINVLRKVFLTKNDLTGGVWEDYTISYKLSGLDTKNKETDSRKFARRIEYKIIWCGKPDSKLYVDYITVYDIRGHDLVFFPSLRTSIADYFIGLTSSANFYIRNDLINIDNKEPIRIIDSIFTEVYKHKLHFLPAHDFNKDITQVNPLQQLVYRMVYY